MIIKLEDLPDTEHNHRYGSEIVRKSLSNPRNQFELELNWILENIDWIPFTSTVTFKNLFEYLFYGKIIQHIFLQYWCYL